MRVGTRFFRMSLWLATTSLTLASTLPAVAQPAPGGPPDAGGGDPPAIAGRLAAITGGVSFHVAGEDHWDQASVNYPVTVGDAFWTEPQASADLEIGGDRVTLNGSTELDVSALDQSQFAANEPQGALYLNLQSVPQGQTLTITTPRASVQLSGAGQYEIVAGDTENATQVTVVQGAAHLTGTNLTLDVGPQQTATIGGSDSFQGSVGPMQQDPFLTAQLQRDAAPPPASIPRQVQYMTGGSELAQYGSWSQTQQYGQVWYPNNVASDWVPYRDGHWSYVAPWGWTWVDNAPWGFAPFHYGRWVDVGDRWGWVAGAEDAPPDAYPVYAPALVSFVGIGGALLAGAALGFAAGELAGGGGIGWVPLGPREPFYPWYHTGPGYFGRVNAAYGVPQQIINRGPTYINNVHTTNITNVTNNYINGRAATVVPASAMTRGQSLRGIARPLPVATLAKAQPIVARQPVAPTAQTPHLTPAVARTYNVAMPARPAGPAAAGPRITPALAGPHAAAPTLRPSAMPANLRPVPAAGAGAPGAAHPMTPPASGPHPGAPALRPPGGGQPPAIHPGAPVPPTAPGAVHPMAPRPMAPRPPMAHPQPNAAPRPAYHPPAPRPMPRPVAPSAPRPAFHPPAPAPRPPAPAPRPMAPRPEFHPPAPPPRPMAPPHPAAPPRPEVRPAPPGDRKPPQ